VRRTRTIALVDLGIEFTGAQSYVQNLVQLLSGDVQLWLIKISPRLTLTGQPESTTIVDLGFAVRWGRPLQILLCMLVLVWLRVRRGLEIVWVNGYPEIALMPWARLLGSKAVATRHLTMLEEKPKHYWLRNGWRVHFLYERIAPVAHAIVCVSETVSESLKNCIRPEKLVVIQNWVPTLPEPVSTRRADTEPLRMLFVGRLTEHKGLALLLRAMRRFDTRNSPRSLSLVVVGEGDERPALEREAEGLDVTFAGFQSDTARYYQQADVFINPTLGPEGLPLVSLDAMSYGLPCIFSDLPVHKEITHNGEAALLFRSGNAEDLKRQVELLAKNPQLIARCGRRAREIVETYHMAELARQRYVEALGL
jgi:glycosyltransferase involved in cell wall biosynthesis